MLNTTSFVGGAQTDHNTLYYRQLGHLLSCPSCFVAKPKSGSYPAKRIANAPMGFWFPVSHPGRGSPGVGGSQIHPGAYKFPWLGSFFPSSVCLWVDLGVFPRKRVILGVFYPAGRGFPVLVTRIGWKCPGMALGWGLLQGGFRMISDNL